MTEASKCRERLAKRGIKTDALEDATILFLCRKFQGDTPNPPPLPDPEPFDELAGKVQALDTLIEHEKDDPQRIKKISAAIQAILDKYGEDD